MEQRIVRVQYAVFPSREAAICEGYSDAEFGTWQPYAGSSELVEGWIALEVEEGHGGVEEMSHCTVGTVDLWPMLLSNVRYAMGRRSTAPSTCQDLIKKYSRYLEPPQFEQIKNEILHELHGAEDLGRTLGDSCDHTTWWATYRWMEKNPPSQTKD